MSQHKIHIRWNTTIHPEKWHVEVMRKNCEGEPEFILSSDSADFPIDVEDFGTFEEDLLIQSVKEKFPGAEICMELI
ncbi:hypothetical protein G9409_07330 [Chlorobium sp. BLA1]|uniref:hypothetical protein n=1 Tax=Candidatus Chlorobium masyuteum TaxID=2716876 RepID=UPI0014202298|nr:hypothetical protein [Candidatus Chlorobium masyuteum]NHQ60404.1 hypothetical protein [Candidatus Chlorobium masyuteum]NTU44021.1 hypothetical protein [Chlorobiaceae bacterium]